MIPVRTPFFLPYFYPSLVWRMSKEEKTLYLTFDDGPVPGPTEFVLDVLAKAQIRATFFAIGDNVRKHPTILNKVISEGHSIGNHTYNHLNGWKTSKEKYIENIDQCKAELGENGKQTSLFRPPYGKMTRAQIKQISDMKIIMWDVLTHDFDKSLSAEKCLRDSIKAVRNGSIILFHDSYKAERNMTYVLPRLIDHCISEGFRFNKLEE